MIQLEELTKEYDTAGWAASILAADRLTLTVPEGEIFGLVGPNGAGKTTTLKLICGLLVPTAGRVVVNGVDVERKPEEAQRHLGYLADFFSVYDDLKVWEYLNYFACAYKMEAGAIPSRVEEVIGLMGLAPKRDAFIAGLSRGMKQRLGIGRAIIHDPPVLVLDEPASGLDPKARKELKDLLLQMNRTGKTVFITSHVLSDLEEMCSSIAIMEKGRLLRVGPLQDVLREGRAGRQVRLQVAQAGFALESWLGSRPEVSGLQVEGATARFAFSGDESALAELIRALVTAGAPVCGVEEVAASLEEVFSRLSSGEVM